MDARWWRSRALNAALGCEPVITASRKRNLLLVATAALLASAFPVTLTDALKRPVRVSQPPQRIISLAPSVTEMLFALGLGPRVVGVTDYCDYPPEAPKREHIGGIVNPSLERVVALHADLVVGVRINPTSVFAQLDRARVVNFALNPLDIAGVLSDLHTLGRLTGAQREADDLIADLKSRLDEVRWKLDALSEAERPRVLFVSSCAPQIWTAGSETWVDDVIRRAGGRNLAADRKDFHTITMETLLRRQPEVIILAAGMTDEARTGDIGVFWGLPGAEALTAVKEHRVFAVPSDPLLRPGPRLVDAVYTMAWVLHPERMRRERVQPD